MSFEKVLYGTRKQPRESDHFVRQRRSIATSAFMYVCVQIVENPKTRSCQQKMRKRTQLQIRRLISVFNISVCRRVHFHGRSLIFFLFFFKLALHTSRLPYFK